MGFWQMKRKTLLQYKSRWNKGLRQFGPVKRLLAQNLHNISNKLNAIGNGGRERVKQTTLCLFLLTSHIGIST